LTLRAVVFDLFGTLVPEFPRSDWERMFEDMARALEVEPEPFRTAWEASMFERQTGRLGDMEANVRTICERLGVEPSPEQLAVAMDARAEIYRRNFGPQPGALETLAWLRARGYPIALISMCAPDAPALWRASLMGGLIDVLVFSSEVGMRKPDAEIYLRATADLGVEPAVCLYVGDGSYRELSGAAAVGMHPVLIRDPAERAGEVHRPQVEDWDGPSIDSLAEIPVLLSA
jgi:putative hydrolase of the HAD superfamily